MSLLETLSSVARSLTRPSPVYSAARAQSPALAPHDSPADVIAALRPTSSLERHQREALVTAVVAEHQGAPQAIWQSILLAAFTPMLLRIRKRVGRRIDEDRDQEVVIAFLEATRAVRAGAYTTLALRWATEATVYGARKKELKAPRLRPFDEHRRKGRRDRDPFGASPFDKVAGAEIVRIIEAVGGRELLDAVLATDLEDETLKDHVDRLYGDRTPRERASAYERIKVGRQGVLGEVRALLVAAA